MKPIFRHIKKLTVVFVAAAAMLVPYFPASAYNTEAGAQLDRIKDNGIPVVYISIDEEAEGYGTIREMNDSIDHSVECKGTVRIDVPDGYKGDYSDIVLEDTEELPLEYIRGRGNFTWQADKKG